MILNSISITSAVFQVFVHSTGKENMKNTIPAILSIIFTVVGYVLFIVNYRRMVVPVVIAIVGTVLVSINWWENYNSFFKYMKNLLDDEDSSQYVINILSSLVKVLVTAVVVGTGVPFWHKQEWAKLASIPKHIQIVVFGLMAIQICSSIMCRWLSVVACKMHLMRRCFVVPMYLASVLSLVLCLILTFTFPKKHPCSLQSNCTLVHSLFADVTNTWGSLSTKNGFGLFLGLLVPCAVSWWLGLLLSTIYVCRLKIQRIERTQELFLSQMYKGAFLEQSLLLNTRFKTDINNQENQNR